MYNKQLNYRLYLVTDSRLAGSRRLEDIVSEAVAGGVSIVQLREKDACTAEFTALAIRLHSILEPLGIPLIINDRIDVALASGAEGVHIGQSDMPYSIARRLLGPDKIIGLSIENMQELEEANAYDGLDYVAASPVFGTPTKTDTAQPWGLDGLRRFCALSKHPVVAIGGINTSNISSIFDAGASGAAVVSAIVASSSPMAAAQELLQSSFGGKAGIGRDHTQPDLSGQRSPEPAVPGEFELIEKIRSAFGSAPDGITGIGDDCAVIPQKSGLDTLVSTDLLMEGVHFLKEDVPPQRLGYKSVMVNISDIAAMGGKPEAAFLSLALPKDTPASWTDRFVEGLQRACSKWGVHLLGGDTSASDGGICINIGILGSAASGSAKLRSGAKVGDLICVTGCLGDSAAGLQAILRHSERTAEVQTLIDRHYLPEARVSEGMSLASCPGVHAMMDISDGVASDLRHILEESGVGAEVNVSRIPLSSEMQEFCCREGLDAMQLALCGGEDYELLFTIDAASEAALKLPHTVIGTITDKAGNLVWKGSDKDYAGFRHF